MSITKVNAGPGELMTTGQAAKRLKVSIQTAIRLFDTGKIKGFVTPKGGHRRLYAASGEEVAKAMGLATSSASEAKSLAAQGTGGLLPSSSRGRTAGPAGPQ